MTQKVAYQVDREDGEGSVVVFDTHGLAARRKGACLLDIGGEDEYCTVRRVKEFDQYAEKGFVPVKALLEAGWWIPSAHDYDILEDTDEFNSEDFVFLWMKNAFGKTGMKWNAILFYKRSIRS